MKVPNHRVNGLASYIRGCDIICNMELHAHVELSDDRVGEYVVKDERPDGSLTLVPDTSFEAIRKRLGTEPGTLADFEAEYGPVQPPDGEG